MEQFKLDAGFFAVHVPYRGIGPAFTDLLGGQTQAMLPGLAAALPHLQSGRVRALAVTGRARHRLLPLVPTFDELGHKGYDGVQWYGIMGPAQMQADVVKRLNDEINRAIAAPELRERLSAEALDPMPMSPDEFAAYVQADIARWSKLARDRNIRLD
jgi:tripartite-type tricarboxylate transporter receptor subunit TctC